jgi:hypothetical protein
MKRFLKFSALALSMVFVTGVLTAAAPVPNVKFELVSGLPSTMNIGQTATATVKLASDQEFISAQAMPDLQYAGKGVVSVNGGDRTGKGTTATLNVTFKAKSSTAKMPGGVVPVSVVVGVRYGGGYVAVQTYTFSVRVP